MTTLPSSRPLAEYRQALTCCLLESDSCSDAVAITGATADSRAVKPGYLFCAIRGAKLDGHDFIPQALAAGAAALVVERPVPGLPAGQPQLLVRDAYHAAALVAEVAAGHPARDLRLAAITGTNGKTTSAYLLRAIFKAAGSCPGMIGTVEYDLGDGCPLPADRTTPTPFQLQELFARLRQTAAEPVILEASSHALAQKRLGTARCQGAIFTNLTRDHLDYHHDFESYYQAKKSLFTDVCLPLAHRVVNLDDPYGRRLATELTTAGLPVTGFARKSGATAQVTVDDIVASAEGSEFTLHFIDQGENLRLRTPLPGPYNIANAAGVATLARLWGLTPQTITSALANCQGAPGRLQKVSSPGLPFQVLVDYAHTDDALDNALTALRHLAPSQLIAVFGCGGDRDRSKRPLMARAAAKNADLVVVTSDNPRTEKPEDIIDEILTGLPAGAAHVAIADRRQAIRHALTAAKPGAIVLIAGKGHEDYQEINGVKHPFNDADVASEIIQELFPAR
ncbi:MAG: UDP-N-acetylmuramoyl-L-alanyl-D-glutamate--2,6-diaminopimelate ligase [Lentisphaerae bacterium]|jgi:UDP-N-acetylmuramoyl-L-alanyl-D-glutamate--2,6-diaminopimelate ligase|nr:UDP-N-acetylmuramoyl-L-alanyl-D-glutamate--2,6-diaminopimelate ligase [Lentisphaerota bacterium]